MNCILFDDETRENLLPLTFTRPVSEIRIGILTITEKWQHFLNAPLSFLTREYLSNKYTITIEAENLLINGSVLPDKLLVSEVLKIKEGEILVSGDIVIAVRLNEMQLMQFVENKHAGFTKREVTFPVLRVSFPWDIFTLNEKALKMDFALLTQGRTSEPVSMTNQIIGSGNLFVEPGAVVECSIINASAGPVYIGKDAEIMEGCIVRGPFALCEHGVLKMGTKIYGATTIGPHCKIGGEISNSVIFGFSNKAHDGFLGNAVIGEWCNLGAGTNNSNLKNNYAEVRVWNYPKESFIKTGLQFCGLIMGDHSKSSINMMFNTGTVVGVSANIFGSGFPRNFVPSFSFGGSQGFAEYQLSKVFEVAEKVMQRRNLHLTDEDRQILKHIFDLTSKYRNF